MSTDVALRCRCGKIRGVACNLSQSSGSRVICYCSDCQAFAHFLAQPGVLDAAGGTDIFQMAPGSIRIDEGASELACVRLSNKGMFRFYAGCCRTPIGNTVGAALPFIGLIHSFMEHPEAGPSRDEALGKPLLIYGRNAIGGMPPNAYATAPFSMIARILVRIVGGWITGRGKSAIFFDSKTKAPRAQPRILNQTEREALRSA